MSGQIQCGLYIQVKKWKSLKLSPKLAWQILAGCCAGFLLLGCSQSKVPAREHTDQEDVQAAASTVSPSQTGKSLTELAGQASMPNDAASTVQERAEHKNENPYVGRYHVQISCDDDFVQCSQGAAEYILTLAADGSAFRSIVYSGKLFSEKHAENSNIQTYRRDTWSVNAEGSELVVHLEEGAEFYYDVDEQHNLTLDLERTLDRAHARNQNFFDSGYPMPSQAYHLIKDQ